MTVPTMSREDIAGELVLTYISHAAVGAITLGPTAPFAPLIAVGTATASSLVQYLIRTSDHANNKALVLGSWFVEAGIVGLALGGTSAIFEGGKWAVVMGQAAFSSFFSNVVPECLDLQMACIGTPADDRQRKWERPFVKVLSTVPLAYLSTFFPGGSAVTAFSGAKIGVRQEREMPITATPSTSATPFGSDDGSFPAAAVGGTIVGIGLLIGVVVCGVVITNRVSFNKAAEKMQDDLHHLYFNSQDITLDKVKDALSKQGSEVGARTWLITEHQLTLVSQPS